MGQEPTSGGLLRPYQSLVATTRRLLDFALIAFARYVACVAYPMEWTNDDTLVTVGAIVIFWMSSEFHGVYHSWRALPFRREVAALGWSWFMVATPLLAAAYLLKTSAIQSRLINTGWFTLALALMVLLRVVVRYGLFTARSAGLNRRTAGIVGATELGRRLREELTRNPSHGIEVVGTYDCRSPDRVAEHLGGTTLLGDLTAAVEDAKAGKLDYVYIALPMRAEERISDMAAALADTTATVQLITSLPTFGLLHSRWTTVGDLPAMSIYDTPFDGVAGGLKRAEDVVLSLLFILLSAPVMLAIALGVKLSSRGPALFVQRRYGLNGKAIHVFKFRTMTVAEEGENAVQATRGDARITRLGAFLRSTSLDELPQFFNVLMGDMSIVGPRPHPVVMNEQYRSLIRGYMLRHKVKPGITGWAQVNGFRGETDTLDKMQDRVRYDLAYIENWRLGWDLQIILKTMQLVLKDKNAY